MNNYLNKTEKTSETAAPTAMYYYTMDTGHLTIYQEVPHHKYVERETTMNISELNFTYIKEALSKLKVYLFGKRCKCKQNRK